MKLSSLSKPCFVAHRGYKGIRPENTLTSFQAALDVKAAMIEFDVSFSKDRKLVIMHDDTLERTTNGKGQVNDHTLAELRELDAGSWFHPDFKGEGIPTLAETLDLIQHKVAINIEIKKEYFEEGDPEDSIENQVADLVEKRGLIDEVVISSFEIRYLERLAKRNPALNLAFITLEKADDVILEKCRSLKFWGFHPWYAILDREQVEKMHRHGFVVNSFTVATDEDYKNLLEMGVDGIITDDIPLFRDAK